MPVSAGSSKSAREPSHPPAIGSPWRNAPPRTAVIFLLAVFFVFTTMGFAGDIIDLGRTGPLRLVISVILTGLFAVFYAIGGFSLRGRFWMAFFPIFAIQFVTMGVVERTLPDLPQPALTPAAEAERLHNRLIFDAVASIVAVSVGYAGFAHVSISEAKRYGRTRSEMALLESEMAAARQVQQVILPEPGQSFPGYKVDSVYKPAREVGGDFFQVLPAGSGDLLIVFGDVAGKGLPAAMLVSMLIGSIRATAEFTHDPVLLLRKLHDRLVGHTSGGFCTAIAAFIAADGITDMASAGHLSPYLDGRELSLPGALPLGIVSGGQYEAVRFQLLPGSRLTFLSDGIVEAQNQNGELFGFDRAAQISMQAPAAISQAAIQFGQIDDITVVAIERQGNEEGAARSRADAIYTVIT
jgi:hypothetical protein